MNPKKFNQLSDKQINKYNQRYKRLKPLFDEKTGEVKTTALKDFYKLNEAEIGAYVQIRAGFDTAFKQERCA
jgi:Ca2+-binding EF-hand superfamily protein